MKPSSKSIEHYTPPAITDLAKQLMGGIDLDPSSCAEANHLVGSDRYFDAEQDGYAQKWCAERVFLNPPGGKRGNRAAAAMWWEKLRYHWVRGDVDQAVFLGFNASIIHTSQSILDFPLCIPSSRIKFWFCSDDPCWQIGAAAKNAYIKSQLAAGAALPLPDGRYLVESSKPQYNNVIAYLPPRSGLLRWEERSFKFHELFSGMGRVLQSPAPFGADLAVEAIAAQKVAA